MIKSLILANILVLAISQTCPGYYGGDLLQSGKYAVVNPYSDSYSFEYETQVYFSIPNSGLEIAVTTATIGDYSPLNDWGYNFFISAQRKGQTNTVKFQVIIRSDRSWSSVQLGYLFNARSDLVVGNFQQSIGEFKSLSPGVYQATHYLNKNLPNLDSGEYKIASFISGFGTTDDVFDLAINEKWYANSAKRVEIVFSCSSNMLLNIIFSFIVYPDVHPILTFTYDNRPDGDGSYHISGPVGYWDDRSIRYDEWRVQNRFLSCAGPTCESNCVRTQQCIEQFGNVWQGRCIYCAPGVVFERGVCARRCGANQFYFNRVCICARGFERKGNECVKQNECGPNQSRIGGKCVCDSGYALWQQSCRKCPNNAESTADRSTCVCSPDFAYNAKQNTCVRRCDISQSWINDRCVCKSGFVSWKQVCRECPSGSYPNDAKTTCVCSDRSKVYFFDSNTCRNCPSGFIANSDRSDCICPRGTQLKNGVCVRECPSGTQQKNGQCVPICPEGTRLSSGRCVSICGPNEKLVNQVCVPRCGQNQQVVNGQCQCIFGYLNLGGLCVNRCPINQQWSGTTCLCDKQGYARYNGACRLCPGATRPNNDHTWCLCQNSNQIFVPNQNRCEACPINSSPNVQGSNCVCNRGYEDRNGVCVPRCGQNQQVVNGQCQCIFGYIKLGDLCVQRCQINQYWSGTSCLCNKGYARYNGACRLCPATTTPNSDQTWCVCQNANQIFVPSRSLCQTCPANSSPNARGSQCICNSGFEDSNGVCIRKSVCPPNSVWDDRTFTCVCTISGQYLIDGKCQSCPQNQGFNGRTCVCLTGFNRIDGVCRTCDPRSTYNGNDCVCNNGFYGNRDSCRPCHSSCGKCTGPEANQCTACADISLVLKDGFCTTGGGPCPIGSYISGSQCKNCVAYCQSCDSETNCQKCAVGFQRVSLAVGAQQYAFCQQICGDGRRFQHACDDGNTRNGDGCNQDCQVQQGWTCVGGTSIRKDSCSQFIPARTILESKGIVNLGGRVVQSVRASYLPACITENQCASCFKALQVSITESLVPAVVNVNFVPESKYQFFVEYDFQGLYVSTAFKVAIRLNRDFDSCFSQDDFNQVLEMTIDPAVLICRDEVHPLQFDENGNIKIHIPQECKPYL